LCYITGFWCYAVSENIDAAAADWDMNYNEIRKPRIEQVKLSRPSPPFFKEEWFKKTPWYIRALLWFKKPVVTRDVSGTATTVCESKQLFGTIYVTSVRTETVRHWDLAN
jgi:hypothetical protein